MQIVSGSGRLPPETAGLFSSRNQPYPHWAAIFLAKPTVRLRWLIYGLEFLAVIDRLLASEPCPAAGPGGETYAGSAKRRSISLATSACIRQR